MQYAVSIKILALELQPLSLGRVTSVVVFSHVLGTIVLQPCEEMLLLRGDWAVRGQRSWPVDKRISCIILF